MKRIINKIREKEGFTLAELLIVVAIIAVLVAIAIPVFTAQLEKSREATDIANLRAAYAEASAELLQNPDPYAGASETTVTISTSFSTIKMNASVSGWSGTAPTINFPTSYAGGDGSAHTGIVAKAKNGQIESINFN